MRGGGSMVLAVVRLLKCSKVVDWGEGGNLRKGRAVVKHITDLVQGTKSIYKVLLTDYSTQYFITIPDLKL
jgi:hypothetical protein